MAIVSRYVILFILLGYTAFPSMRVQVRALGGDKDDNPAKKDDSCPPPPSPPYCPPPPPPPACKRRCKDCKDKDSCEDGKPKKSPFKSPKPKDDDDDKPTDKDVRNLNDLLAVQFVLNDILLRASLGQQEQMEAVSSSSSRKTPVLQSIDGGIQQIVPDMLTEFSAISVAQVNSILSVLRDQAIPRPSNLNVSNEAMSLAVNRAFNGSLSPDYNIGDDPTKLLLAVQTVGPALAASVATDILPNLESNRAVSLVAGILPALASQDASMRTVLYSERDSRVDPYNYTVGDFVQRTSRVAANLQATDGDSGGSARRTGGDILSVNVLGAGVGMSAPAVMGILSDLLGIAGINV